jgi:hypothetical protein
MKMKRKEFLALKQGAMMVTEYRDRFLQLARYAPAEVANCGRTNLNYTGSSTESSLEGYFVLQTV